MTTAARAAEDGEDLLASLSDPARFTRIFERHASDIHRYLGYRVGSDLADDLTAETFLQAFRGRRSFRSAEGEVKPWLYGFATNLLRRHRREEARRRRSDWAARSVARVDDPPAEQAVDRVLVDTAIGRLDRKSREVVLLVAGAGLSYEEAAAALGIPVGTVRSRLARARQRLRTDLDPTTKEDS
jgi:RNA polymerase sigma factor (sigma-70 family)